MHPFRAYISLYTQISDEDWDSIESSLEFKIVQPNRILLHPGEVCTHLYFLANGSIRYYAEREDSKVSLHFVHPPSFFVAVKSFSNNTPSEFGIQALEESYVWFISRENVNKLMTIPVWEKFLVQVSQQ